MKVLAEPPAKRVALVTVRDWPEEHEWATGVEVRTDFLVHIQQRSFGAVYIVAVRGGAVGLANRQFQRDWQDHEQNGGAAPLAFGGALLRAGDDRGHGVAHQRLVSVGLGDLPFGHIHPGTHAPAKAKGCQRRQQCTVDGSSQGLKIHRRGSCGSCKAA